MGQGIVWLIIIVVILILSFLRQVDQYERGVKFLMGRYQGTMSPGWRLIVPVFQQMRKVDIRVKAVEVPSQEAITKDNVSCQINAVIYYKVMDAAKAVIEVEDFRYAVLQLAQTTMRNIVGEVELDELLSQRDKISHRIQEIVEAAAGPWGLEVGTVELKDILLPDTMKRMIAQQAEAEREKRAVIIKAEGEVIAAENMSKAAAVLSRSNGALHLRTLQTIDDISSDQSNTVIFAMPLEVLRAFDGFIKVKDEK